MYIIGTPTGTTFTRHLEDATELYQTAINLDKAPFAYIIDSRDAKFVVTSNAAQATSAYAVNAKVLPNGNLCISVKDLESVVTLQAVEDLSPVEKFSILVNDSLEGEYHTTSSNELYLHDIGVLTDAQMVMRSGDYYDMLDDAKISSGVWAYMDYQIHDPIVQLLRHGSIELEYGSFEDDSEIEE